MWAVLSQRGNDWKGQCECISSAWASVQLPSLMLSLTNYNWPFIGATSAGHLPLWPPFHLYTPSLPLFHHLFLFPPLSLRLPAWHSLRPLICWRLVIVKVRQKTVLTRCEEQAGFLLIWSSMRGVLRCSFSVPCLSFTQVTMSPLMSSGCWAERALTVMMLTTAALIRYLWLNWMKRTPCQFTIASSYSIILWKLIPFLIRRELQLKQCIWQ